MRRTLLTAALLGIAAFTTPAWAETVKLTFLLTNDIYNVEDAERGGFARLNAVVKAERAKGGNVIYAHAGDLISPSLLSGLDQGAHTIALTNLVPPDIFTPGNHEFDFGEKVFRERMNEAKFPLFAANLRTKDGEPLPGFRDTEMRDFGGLKVGFVGLTADDSPVKSSPGDNLVFAPTFETALAQAKLLKSQGADLIVAVAHAKREVDLKLYQSGAFDLILSGDDHDLALFFDGNTVLAESMTEANYVTAIDVTVDVSDKDGKRRVTWWPDFRVIDTATVTPDPGTQAQVDAYRKELDADLNVAIGMTTEPLDSRKATLRTQEAAIGNLVADALRAQTGADVAIINGGGLRGNKQYPAGAQLSRRDILTEMPFGNRTVKLSVTGDMIRAALENGVSDVSNAAGRFPQVSGLSFTADLMRPVGQRVDNIMIGGKPLDPAAGYTLATNDYMAAGGDGYVALEAGKPLLGVRDGKLMANDVMAYIAAQKTVAPKVEGRIGLRM
ncbi:bifunctional metallophosphatase/5'-nucleotidase [Aestuariivirga litoralis]|uniref:Bifunctional metallophosphatase/5'-nucleotidase n=2 Tax=Aestuariivirga litoralis TaxID=2650924 RepID=A0A2W2C7F8_9HYPH|nr:bifunctional metallophosphatase/5'-nucleotidase [Aestuariivirga litoralis]